MTARELREMRIGKGHSLAAAAAVAGVSRRTWIRWEQGDAPIDVARVELYRLDRPVENTRRRDATHGQ